MGPLPTAEGVGSTSHKRTPGLLEDSRPAPSPVATLLSPCPLPGNRSDFPRKKCVLAVLSTEGRVVGPCWEHLKPGGPKATQSGPSTKSPFWGEGVRGEERDSHVAEKLGRFLEDSSSEIENFVPGSDLESVYLNDSGTNS